MKCPEEVNPQSQRRVVVARYCEEEEWGVTAYGESDYFWGDERLWN